MISKYLLRDYLVGFCLKILNSAVVIGLYYGFLTTASIGPSYLLLIRARVMEKGSETEIAATTGFITGRLMIFISIYYAPLHLALNRPHTITFLTVPYLFFHFVHKNDKHYYSGGWGSNLDSGYKNPNSIRNFRIYKVFFNNLFFQLFSPLLLPSSILNRLMNIYLFRSNNKLVFLTSSFVGWLIGHIFLMKCIGLVLVWLKQKNSIKSKITMRFDKYILLQLRNYVGQIFVIFSFVLFAYCLGKGPLPYFYIEEMIQYDNRDMEEIQAAIDAETEETNEEEDLTVYLSENEKKEKTSNNMNIEKKRKIVPLEKSLVTTLFDYQRWNRPLRYIKNDHFERVVRDENSQFFFQTCESDGKKRISFTYPPNLSTFLNMMEKKMDLFRREKTSYNDNELYHSWSSVNKEKKNKLSNELFQRAKILDNKGKNFNPLDVFENRIRLSDDKMKTKYLPKIYDPFLNGRVRGEIQKSVSPFIANETSTRNSILINKIHGLLLSINSNSPELEQKIDQFDRKLVLTEIGFLFHLISKFSEKSVSSLNFDGLYLFPEHEQVKIYSEEKKRKRNLLFDAIRTDPTNNTIFNRKLWSEINEISKQVPRWSYPLIDDLEVLMDAAPKEAHIRSAKAERIVLYNDQTQSLGSSLRKKKNTNDNENRAETDNDNKNKNSVGTDLSKEFAIPHYSREPDYDRELIRGSVRAQRRKTVTWKLFQPNVHSPVFFEIIDNYSFLFGDLFHDISQYLKEIFRKPGTDNSEFLEFQKAQKEKQKEDDKDEDEIRLKQIEEAWESILYGLIIRSFVLLFQSMFRKYILLPSLIITKNIIRMLFFQNPEWSEDLRDWRKEVHINCTYQGIPVSHNALPPNWFWDGMQIRILCPFVLKPWHNKSKVRSTEKKKRSTEKRSTDKNFWFLTGYGTLVESYLDDHVPNPFLFLGPILKKITKQLKKDLKNRFRKFYNERKRKKGSGILLEELKEKKLEKIENKNGRLKKELSEIKKNSPISKSNPMIEESPVIIQSINWTNSSSTEKRIKYLNDKTKTILKQIEKMKEEKKEGVITDAQKFELIKNRFKILQRRNVRLIRKSYCFFQIFMERLYIHILTTNYVELFLTSSIVQRYLNYLQFTRYLFELTKKIVNKSIYNKKKNDQRVDKTNQSIIPFMSIIDKPWNITDMNSQTSCDVSSLSQAYVLFKLSQQIQVSNGYKYKLRSIFESHGRSIFLKNEIKDYFFRIQGGRLNSKLRHKNRPDSIMNQWTNWLKVHYQYALPQRAWSRLVAQKWRNRIHEHRVAQNKDLVEYDSSQKTLFIFSKKQQVDLLKKKIKIKKQYGYDLFSYQYINYADKKKSYIYGYKSPSYNTPKNIEELFDIMGDSFIQNYIAEDGTDMVDRKYFHWMGRNGKRKKNSITNQKLLTPTFGFFSEVRAYKENPWILPINLFFVPFYGNKNITNAVQLGLEKKEYASQADLKSYLSKSSYSAPRYKRNTYRMDLTGERNFLLDKYLGSYLHCKSPVQEALMDNINISCLLLRLKNLKKFTILSIKKGELDIETLVRLTSKDTCYTECRDTEELKDHLMFFMEPFRISMKNHEQFLIYQTIRISLKHKRKISKKKSRLDQKITENKDKNQYDLLIPENLLSTRRRRELRILICLNSRNRKTVDRNTVNEEKINNSSQVFTKNKDLDSDTKKLMNLKFFLWPNYRFEDLACMNRYWFDTHNGSRFSILRIRMYPKI
uniref:Protein TIC 214 n=1 Tax=Lathyrus clymenum TaxID=3855 RepID=A0A0F6NKF5_LATCY|nr:hypothetical chloroplast RF19 [Lathyrus clymenum]AIL55810.1 hypothetical chloroplast RF19 [Lathyrus clymenum]